MQNSFHLNLLSPPRAGPFVFTLIRIRTSWYSGLARDSIVIFTFLFVCFLLVLNLPLPILF